MKKSIASLKIFFIFFLFWFIGGLQIVFAATPPVGLDSIAAIVNNGTITTSQLSEQVRLTIKQLQANHAPVPPIDVLRKKILTQLINDELQLQAAKKVGIEVDNATIDQAIANVAAQNGISVSELQKKLQEEGVNYKQYRKQAHDQLVISQVQQRGIAPHVKVSDQEVTDFLALHGKELTALQHPTPTGSEVYHLLVMVIPLPEEATQEQIATAQQAAQKVFSQLNSNTNFEQFVTTKLGTDLNLQQQDLGWRTLSQLPDLYMKPVQNLQPGTLAGPIRAPNGFHIIKLVESRGGTALAIRPQHLVETHVRHILLKSNPLLTDAQLKTQLQRLRASILAGTPFEQVATANSQDPGSAPKGGDIGWVTPGALDPAFEAVMNQMKPGQISVPFKSQFGWHILQVLDRKTQHDPEILRRDMAKQILFQRKVNTELQRWLQDQRNSGYVKVLIQ